MVTPQVLFLGKVDTRGELVLVFRENMQGQEKWGQVFLH